MSTISAKKRDVDQEIPFMVSPSNHEQFILRQAQDERKVKETLLVSMKEKAAILRHLQEKDLVQEPDAMEIREILGDLDQTIKALETANV